MASINGCKIDKLTSVRHALLQANGFGWNRNFTANFLVWNMTDVILIEPKIERLIDEEAKDKRFVEGWNGNREFLVSVGGGEFMESWTATLRISDQISSDSGRIFWIHFEILGLECSLTRKNLRKHHQLRKYFSQRTKIFWDSHTSGKFNAKFLFLLKVNRSATV